MLSIAQMAGAGYYAGKALVDYVSNAGHCVGAWFGRAAASLGYIGPAKSSDVARMHDGIGPDGGKLVRGAGTPAHYPGPDATNSVPKSQSVLWAAHPGPSARAELESVTLASNRDALQLFEDFGAWTRLGKGGHIVEQAQGICVTSYLHTLSRGVHDDGVVDMNIHVHNCIHNVVLCRDGGYRTLLGITAKKTADKKDWKASRSALYQLKMVLGAAFQESLARRVEALGYDVERTRDGGFEVVGVPRELCEYFSTRRKHIVEDMKRRGVTGAREAAYSAKTTRPAKSKLSAEELFARWQEIARARGFDAESVRVRAPRQIDEVAMRADLRAHIAAIAAVAQAKSMGQSVGKNRSNVRPMPAATHGLAQTSAQGQASDSRGRDTTSQVDDVRMLTAAATIGRVLARARRDGSHRVTRARLWLTVKMEEYLHRTPFRPEEKRALVDITRTRGSVQFLSGASGERIAPVLKAAAKAWAAEGYRVLLATSSKASAARFEQQIGVRSISLCGLDHGMRTNRGLLRGYVSSLRKSLTLGPRMVKGKKPYPHGNSPKRRFALGFSSGTAFVAYALAAAGRFIRVDRKSIVILHDVDSLALPERAALIKRLHRSGAKLVFLHETRPASAMSVAIQSDNRTGRQRVERTQADRDTHEEERSARERSRSN